MDLLTTVTTRSDLTHAWLAYSAIGETGEWLFARFVPVDVAPLLRAAEQTFAARVQVEDYAGDFGGPEYGHNVALIALAGDDLVVSFDSAARGQAAMDAFEGERGTNLGAAVRNGDLGGMYQLLAGIRYLTPSCPGVLLGFPSGAEMGSVRIDMAPYGADSEIAKGLMGRFPNRHGP